MTPPQTKQDNWQQYQWLEEELAGLIGPVRFSSEINLRLERITRLLELLGNPHLRLRSVHVGGTSGKGSTAVMIASMLTAAGYRVGLHTSPHLQVLNERHQINGRMAPTTALVRLWQQMKPAIAEMRRNFSFGAPSYFEAQFALSCLWFVAEDVDTAVVEVGLGGLLDATNVLPADVTVLTNVGLDHTEILGDTVELIAQDKSGIIKAGQITVSGCTQPSVQAIVAEKATAVGAQLWQLGRDFAAPEPVEPNLWRFALPEGGTLMAELGLPGPFQAQNGAVAQAAVSAVGQKLGLTVSDAARQTGLRMARLAGRIEQVQSNPTVILDGAHNPDKVEAVASVMRARRTAVGQVITVLAIKEGKAAGEMLPAVAELSDVLLVTRFGNKGLWRAMSPEALAAEAQALAPGLTVLVEPNPLTAVERALALAEASPESMVWVTGSLYLVGDVRARWHSPADILWALEQTA